MDAVKAFNAELSALYEVKPPISKAKMNSLTRGAIKAIKFYKHVVQSVEKFIQKCKPEYKVPGLYVIDSIVRQSRHQFGIDKDVFAPRFAKNMQMTFLNLLKCPPEDKSKVIRVLNLWQKNSVFPSDVIQPLFDLVDPNHPIHKEQTNSNAKQIDPAWLAQTMECSNMVQTNSNQVESSFLDRLQHLQQILLKNKEAANDTQTSVKFDKKLLDFDYGEEEEDDSIRATSPTTATPLNQYNSTPGSLESLGLLLTNPEVLRQLQTLQQTMQGGSVTNQHEMEEKMRKLQQMKQQEEEFDKHLAQTVPNLPFASECELTSSDLLKQSQQQNVYSTNINASVVPPDMSQPPPGYPATMPYVAQPPMMRPMGHDPLQDQKSPLVDEVQDPDYQGNNVSRRDSSSVEIVNCESVRSQSRSPERFRRHSRSRSPRHRDRDRGRDRDRDRDRKSRSRSTSRRRRSRSRDRDRDRKREESRERERMSEEERERQRERRKRGLPPIIREKLSVCSTTLWVGHLSKLVHQEELSDTFGEFGDIVSIDLIPPRGCAFICMNRRQDAYRALTKLKNHKMQGKAITLAWAPGKGVKGKEWKDYWEVESGVSYIPWSKLNDITDADLDLLEEGGMIDDETLPPHFKGRLQPNSNSQSLLHSLQQSSAGLQAMQDNMVTVIPTVSAAPPPLVDTSQPPPIRAPNSAPLLPTNPQLQMIPPGFTMSGVPRMLGPMGLPMPHPHGLMPNVPIGVPPPNMQGLLGPPGMMQSMLTSSVNSPFGTGVNVGALLTQIPLPTPAAPSDKQNSNAMGANVPPLGVPPPSSESNLSMMRQSYNVATAMQMSVGSQQSSHGDDMDVEMEDVMAPSSGLTSVSTSGTLGGAPSMPPKEKQNLSDQLLAVMKSENDGRDYGRDRDRGRGDRDRDRDDRGRDRGRGGRDRGRERRRDRDERRDRDGRESSAMRHAELNEMESKKESKMSLTDRLRQLADGTLPLDDRMDRGRGPRNDRSAERHERGGFDDGPPPMRRLNDQPPALMDLPKFGGPPDRPRGPDFRGNSQEHGRDFAQRERDRPGFGHRGVGGGGPRGPLGPMDEFNDPRMHPGRFPDERLDGRLGGLKGAPRPDEFDPRLGHALTPRDEFDRPELRGRHPPPTQEDFERERFEFEMRQRGEPRPHELADFEPRRREFFRNQMEQGFGGPMGPMMGPRGPRGTMGPDGFGLQRPPGPRGHGPPMFHPRGMGPRGMRPGMRPMFGARGMGPQFGEPREPGEPFFRPPFDDGGRGPPHLRMPFGPRMSGPPLMREEGAPWRSKPENGPPGWEPETEKSKSSPANRSRKSRWGNASPRLADKENWDEVKEEDAATSEQPEATEAAAETEWKEEPEVPETAPQPAPEPEPQEANNSQEPTAEPEA